MRKTFIRKIGYETRMASKITMLFSLLCFVSVSIYAQDKSIPIPSFDQSGEVVAKSVGSEKWNPTVGKSSEEGEITLQVLDTELGSTHIQYEYQKTSRPNPFTVNYDYYINTLADGRFSVDVDAFMDPIDLYVDESIKLTYNGDDVVFPSTITNGSPIDDVAGTYAMVIDGVAFDKQYNVRLSNFTIKGATDKIVNGKTYKAHQLSFEYYNDVTFNGSVLSTKQHQVTGFFIPNLGFIQSNRSGSNDMMHNKVDFKSKSSTASKS